MSYRKFKVVPKPMQLQLHKQYGDLQDFSHGWLNNEINQGLSITYFDHWLSEKEHHLLDNVDEEEHKSRSSCFYSFLEDLSKFYQIYSYRIHGKKHSNIQFREFTNNNSMYEYFRSANYSMCKSTYPKLILPECNAVIHQTYDYTAYLGFKSREEVSQILSLAKENSLHTLEWRN